MDVKKIRKDTARRAYNAGYMVILMPSKCGFNSLWVQGVRAEKNFQDIDFDNLNLEDLTAEESDGACGSSPEEEDKLIYNRNANWAKAMPKIMAADPTLFAVGAAHLCGEKGVLALLKEQGYSV